MISVLLNSLGAVIACSQVVLAVSATPEIVRFPGLQREISSPNERYVVEYREPSQDHPPYLHTLVLRDRLLDKRTELLSFTRFADVAWAPDGRRLAVTDHRASNQSVTYLVSLDDGPKKTDVSNELRREQPDLDPLFANDHCYVDIVRWLDDKTLQLRIHGHGDQSPAGFERQVDYRVVGKET
jgi:hypothetical protein